MFWEFFIWRNSPANCETYLTESILRHALERVLKSIPQSVFPVCQRISFQSLIRQVMSQFSPDLHH